MPPYVKIFTMIRNKYYPNKSISLLNIEVCIINITVPINIEAQKNVKSLHRTNLGKKTKTNCKNCTNVNVFEYPA